jgi:isochorismate pyruvate lyase
MEIKKCSSLEEARQEIDKLDDRIVELIAARNAYIRQLAHFKDSVDEIKAEDRIADVINHVRSKAIELDLSPNLINDLYLRMIDAMVDTEVAEFKNAKNF